MEPPSQTQQPPVSWLENLLLRRKQADGFMPRLVYVVCKKRLDHSIGSCNASSHWHNTFPCRSASCYSLNHENSPLFFLAHLMTWRINCVHVRPADITLQCFSFSSLLSSAASRHSYLAQLQRARGVCQRSCRSAPAVLPVGLTASARIQNQYFIVHAFIQISVHSLVWPNVSGLHDAGLLS